MKRYNPLFPFFEKTYNIKRDVEYIYNKAYRQFMNEFTSEKMTLRSLERWLYGQPIEISSDELKSPDCVNAHKLDPIVIFCGFYNSVSHYDPLGNKQNRYPVVITPDVGLIHAMIMSNYDISTLDANIKVKAGLEKYKPFITSSINYQLEKESIKQTIAHELTHWIDDVSQGKFLLTRALKVHDIENNALLDDKTKDALTQKIMSKGKPHRYMVDTEVNAMIHQIEALKDTMTQKDWDKLTLEDLFVHSDIYYTAWNIRNTAGREEYYKWQKQIISRLHRENLLGKNMRNMVIFEHMVRRGENKRLRLVYN